MIATVAGFRNEQGTENSISRGAACRFPESLSRAGGNGHDAMSASIARYLKDFGDPQPPQPAAMAFDEPMSFGLDTSFQDDFPQIAAGGDDSLREEAYAEGYEAASAALALQHQQEMDALRRHMSEEMEALRQGFEAEAASRIRDGLRAMAQEIAGRIADEAAACLAPLVHEEIAEKAVADLAVLIREAILEGEAGTIIVKGPLSLFNILATEMGDDASMLRHVEAADLDLTVEIAGSVLVTRLSAFAASLKKVLE